MPAFGSVHYRRGTIDPPGRRREVKIPVLECVIAYGLLVDVHDGQAYVCASQRSDERLSRLSVIVASLMVATRYCPVRTAAVLAGHIVLRCLLVRRTLTAVVVDVVSTAYLCA